ncbi:MAG: hypothetical protein J0M18_19325, partial [Ignavibacteria bacterium]|nr:hypothetical protein [Ignavibacteria bacterium]
SFIAATSLDNIIGELSEIKYNQEGLLSYITMGYTPVYQTLYESIGRFKTNEYIKITNDKLSYEYISENFKIRDYDKSYIDKYDVLISNSILSRSRDSNYVLNSGGWDSTSIIYHLLQAHDSKKINSVVYETKLKSGGVYNIYETDKVKKISDYYGINSEKIEIDFNDKKNIRDWENIRDDLKNYHTYFFVDMPKAVNEIAIRNNNAAIFSGEASDSIHNFGFSQFVSVTYPNRELREYGDKMKSYLFGPSFFRKIVNGSYQNDKVFQFFKFYFGEENLSEENLISYFRSFMISSERIPFAKPVGNKFVKKSLQDKIELKTQDNIFSSLSSNSSSDNLYYSLLQLYREYHFHSPQIEVKHSPLRRDGNNCKIPFLDSSLVKFMYSMPESWGRGLELRPTKYPLRYLAHEKWNIPLSILEESGAHSYIAESDKRWNYSGGSWSLAAETIYNSVFGDCYKSILAEIKLEKYFSTEYFETDLMQKAVDDYVNGKEDLTNSNLIYKLGVLFFIGLYD